MCSLNEMKRSFHKGFHSEVAADMTGAPSTKNAKKKGGKGYKK